MLFNPPAPPAPIETVYVVGPALTVNAVSADPPPPEGSPGTEERYPPAPPPPECALEPYPPPPPPATTRYSRLVP